VTRHERQLQQAYAGCLRNYEAEEAAWGRRDSAINRDAYKQARRAVSEAYDALWVRGFSPRPIPEGAET